MLLARLALARGIGILGFDVWILDYPPGASVPSHLDPVPLARHFRLNVILQTGGTRYRGKSLWRLGERVVFFRPDRMVHEVEPCKKRRRVVSVGWAVRP